VVSATVEDDPYGDKWMYDQFRETAEAATHVQFPLTEDKVSEALHQRLDHEQECMRSVTGEPGDVKKDPFFYTADSYLTFKDVRFAVNTNEPKGLAKLTSSCFGDDETEEKVILEPTSGYVKPGELVALMGPSGCGKSTLLDMLADKKTAPYTGDIRFNGHERDPELFSRVTAYLPQEDVMWAHATVRETVEFVEKLAGSYPSNITEELRDKRIDTVLSNLGLTHVANTKIGDHTVRGISGGQKRRVTLAKSLMTFASIIFADEPTSGLSSTDAETCIKSMRHSCHAFGMSILVVIHQPRIEVVKLFDRLMLLTAMPGRMVFNGAFKECEAFYEKIGYPVPDHANPADHYLDMITPGAKGAQPDEFVKNFNENKKPALTRQVDTLVGRAQQQNWPDELGVLEKQREAFLFLGDIPEVKPKKQATGFCTQLSVVTGRRVVLTWRDKKSVFQKYFFTMFEVFLLGFGFLDIFKQSAALQLGAFYVITIEVALESMVDMPRLISERYLMKTEVFSSLYSHLAFIIPFITFTGIINFTSNCLLIVLVFLFAGWSAQLFPEFFGWTLLAWFTFDSLFAMIAALAATADQASAIGTVFLFLFLMYNGFTITKVFCPDVVVWLIYISPAYYVIEGLAINGQKWAPEGDCPYCSEAWDAIVDFYQFEADNWILGICICLGYGIIFRIMQVVFLTTLHAPQK